MDWNYVERKNRNCEIERSITETTSNGDRVKESPESRAGDAQHSIRDGAVPVESILRTEELKRRPWRPPDYEAENRALVALSQALADSPRTVLQTLADTLLKVCRAGSAGISLLTSDDNGKRFYWPAIAGSWKPHIGGGTPRDFGPCGDVLDRNTTLLFGHIERRYTYFEPVKPLVEEALLVPFYVRGKAVGTIWAVSHDPLREFDAEDERIMSSLGKFASSAYQILESLEALKFEVVEREKAEAGLRLVEQVRVLSRRLIQMQDEQRRRIARELHDSAGQILAALGMNLASVVRKTKQSAPEIANEAEKGEQLVRELTQEIRTTSYLLHPPLLDESGLCEALRWYVQGLQERSGLDVALDIPEDLGRLSDDMELGIFRIVQECLINVHRHSGSKVATIRIARGNETISVQIQDEGKGIPDEKLAQLQSRGGGVGILGMRERVLQLEGAMDISSDARGTTISITIPLPKISGAKLAEHIQPESAE